jgi:Peptidase A4 family
MMSGDKLQSDMLSRIRTYESTPEGFDPHTAPDRELRRYGLPRRPDPVKEPYLARLWKRAFMRPTRFVRAELAIDPVIGTRRDRWRGRDSEFGLSSGWSGVVRMMNPQTDYPTPATMVFAQWVVPEVWAIEPAGENLTVAFWVGLDGYEGLDDAAAHQVLQAGIVATVEPGGWFSDNSVQWRAWTEWYSDCPGCAAWVKNFPVVPGDTVSFLVCAPQPDSGFVSMLNVSKRLGASVDVSAPSCTTSDGSQISITSSGHSAEWIVETFSEHLPIFAPVTFTGCGAGSAHELFQLTPHGITVDRKELGNINIDAPGPPFTRTTIVPPTTAVVEELELGWF